MGELDQVTLAKRARAQRLCKSSFAAFFRAFPPKADYLFGQHTNAIIERLQGVVQGIEEGRSSHVVINVPPRHGKSDITSRRFPAWTLCKHPEWEVILATYNDTLASEMSLDARRCFSQTGPIFGLGLDKERNQIKAWRVGDHEGGLFATGIGGTVTGRGAHILIIDDYLKNRAEAESEIIRDRIWSSFQSDLISRLAPVHAVVIVANRWHVNDLVGQIQNKSNPDHQTYDPDFAEYEVIKFPAVTESDEGEKFLFSERFSPSWYKQQRAAGSYAWKAQFQQDPRLRTGNLLCVDKAKVNGDFPEGLRWQWGWDIASTEKQRAKDDPDFSVGVKTAYDAESGILYIGDVVRGQWGVVKRNGIIEEVAKKDGTSVIHYVESVGSGLEAYQIVKSILAPLGIAVRKFQPKGDKVARASIALEALFETGHVHIRAAPWTPMYLDELASFPSGAHDDQIDGTVASCHNAVTGKGRMGMSR